MGIGMRCGFEEETMWLAIASVTLASAIGFYVLAIVSQTGQRPARQNGSNWSFDWGRESR
jgi:hypothetical protein